MYIIIPIMAITLVISFMLARRIHSKISSDCSPFSYAEDILIINTGSIFSIPRTSIEQVELHYNPKAMHKRFYEMSIHIVKTDGTEKKVYYKGSRSGVQPQDMATALMAHNIRCVIKD